MSTDLMKKALSDMTEEILAVRNECDENALEFPRRFAQASFDHGYQMAMNTLYMWLDETHDDFLRSKLEREIEAYVDNKDDWMMQLHHQPWNEVEL
jgi:hypothetical protein